MTPREILIRDVAEVLVRLAHDEDFVRALVAKMREHHVEVAFTLTAPSQAGTIRRKLLACDAKETKQSASGCDSSGWPDVVGERDR